MRGLILAGLVCLVVAGPAAGEVTIQASVDQDAISLEGEVVLTVTVSGETEDLGAPQLPPLPEFVSVGTGSRQNLVIVNGQVSKSTSYTFTLMPRQTGRLVIGPVTIETPRGKLATEPITISVTQAGSHQPARPEAPRSGREDRRRTPDPFYVEAGTDKRTVYLGEQLTYTFSFFRNISVSETNNFTPPQTTGFISVDLPPQRKRTQIIDGETYSVVQVVTAMFPTRTGVMTIGPARLRVVPDMISNLLGRDPLNWLRGGRRSPLTSGEPRNLATRAFEIDVKPLPPPPTGKSFSGAVGTCQLACDISADSVGVGDPVTVIWTLTGIGRKDVVDAPQIEWPAGVETYPPTTELTTSTRDDVVRETKVFKIAVVPRREGTITIPAPELTYFNPKRAQYETARGRLLNLTVGPPRSGIAMAAPTQTISAAASTIRYLKSAPEQWETGQAGTRVLPFMLLQLAAPLAVAVFFVWKRRFEAPEQRARGARQRAMRHARKQIAALADHSDTRRVADELSTAFRRYLTARFSLSPGDLLSRDWLEPLRAGGCAAADAEAAERVLQWADQARFGGGSRAEISPRKVLELMQRLDKCAVS
jgi:hypothetical protein